MRWSNSSSIVLLCVAVATAGLINVASAAEKTTLSSIVKRLLIPNRSHPTEQRIEQPAARSTARLPRYRRPARVPQATDRRQPFAATTQMTRLPSPSVNALPLPPSPPAVSQAWVHPPKQRPEPSYTPNHVLALTRDAGFGESSRRGFQTPSRDSALEVTEFDPTHSLAMAQPEVLPANAVRQVNYVTETAGTAVKSLPIESPSIESFSVERKPVGNTPAEVRTRVDGAPREIESDPIAKPMEVAQVSEVRLPASTLPPVFRKVRGRIAAIDVKKGVIHVDLSDDESLPAGTEIKVSHENPNGEIVTVQMRVVNSVAGVVAAKLIDGESADAISLGDKTIAWKRDSDE